MGDDGAFGMNSVELPELPGPYAAMDSTGEIHWDVSNWIGTLLYTSSHMQQYALLACGDLHRRIADLESQLESIGAGGVSKLMGDTE